MKVPQSSNSGLETMYSFNPFNLVSKCSTSLETISISLDLKQD